MPIYKNIITKYITIKNYYYFMNNKLNIIVITYKYIYFFTYYTKNKRQTNLKTLTNY